MNLKENIIWCGIYIVLVWVIFPIIVIRCSTTEKFYVLEKGNNNIIIVHQNEFMIKKIGVPSDVYDTIKEKSYIFLKEKDIKKWSKELQNK